MSSSALTLILLMSLASFKPCVQLTIFRCSTRLSSPSRLALNTPIRGISSSSTTLKSSSSSSSKLSAKEVKGGSSSCDEICSVTGSDTADAVALFRDVSERLGRAYPLKMHLPIMSEAWERFNGGELFFLFFTFF